MVLVSDGADTTDASLDEALLGLKAAACRCSPWGSAGIGSRATSRSIGCRTPRTALQGTSLVIDAVVTQTGYAGETVSLDVEDEGRIVGSQEVKLPQDGEPAAVRVRFTAADAGAARVQFRIAPRPASSSPRTTSATRSSTSPTAREDPLLRGRAAARDGVPQPRGVRRQESRGRDAAAHRRQQIPAFPRCRQSRPAAAGFPKTREELFAYRGSCSAASKRAPSPAISCA